MIKKNRKILYVILIIGICNMWLFITPVNAQGIGQAINSAQIWVQQPNGTTVINPQAVYDFLNMVYGLVYGIAIALLIIQGIFLGMRIILGTIAERVDAKAMLRKYILIALGLAFGGAIFKTILEWVMTVVQP